MWVEQVTARAFGLLRDAVLDLAPGLTVIAGRNEAGKSTWHAATRLALTGRRRGKGGRTLEDREVERYRPWDDAEGPWEVGARLHLDDGRVIELSQDLAGRVDCRAVDVGLGRDVSAEIIADGSPDASRWLGLDRQAFAATVSVDQARILSILDSADGLQDDLQRAAASAGRDATAAEAISRVTDFRKAAVGADTRVAVGPLRQARQAVAESTAALAEVQARHDRYLAGAVAAQAAATRAIESRGALARAEAVHAQARAGMAIARAQRAAQLATRHPTAPAPLAMAQADSAQVATALAAWRNRPAVAVLDGPGSDAIAQRLADLPAVPRGDLAPHPSVQAAMSALDQAEGAAAELAVTAPDVSTADAGRWVWMGGGAALLGLAAVIALLAGAGLIGLALGLGAMVLAGLALSGRASGGPRPAREDLAARRQDADRRVSEAVDALRSALIARDAEVDGDPRQAVATYQAACEERARAAAEAARAEGLQRELEARRHLEGSASEAAAAIERANTEVRAAAQRVGQPANGTDLQYVVAGLESWQEQQAAELAAGEQAIAEWQELVDLLDGRTLAEVEAEAREAAEQLSRAGVDQVSLPVGSDGRAAIEAAEQAVIARRAASLSAEQEASRLGGEAHQLREGLPSVAAAEEAVAAARAELSRVESVAAVLDRTLDLLRQSEEQVHRDLAPVLKEAVRVALPRITDGRYVDAAVDPRDLRVQVKEATSGQWREAARLSEGAREQVYLLLRVALAQHLVTTGETSPLFLDEVTAQADDGRRDALLGLLHDLSRDRQVVVFTHDPRIAEWAAGHLDTERDALVNLDQTPAAGRN
jgi:exonuclease SbcC